MERSSSAGRRRRLVVPGDRARQVLAVIPPAMVRPKRNAHRDLRSYAAAASVASVVTRRRTLGPMNRATTAPTRAIATERYTRGFRGWEDLQVSLPRTPRPRRRIEDCANCARTGVRAGHNAGLGRLHGLLELRIETRVHAPISERGPFFIVGSPRSGTGLLRDLVRAHPAIEIPSESHFIPALFHGYRDPLSERTARTLARRILALRWVRAWHLTTSLRPTSRAAARMRSSSSGCTSRTPRARPRCAGETRARSTCGDPRAPRVVCQTAGSCTSIVTVANV